MKWQLKSLSFAATIAVAFSLAPFSGCSNSDSAGGTAGTPNPDGSGETPSFSLAWSEYPSWSVFGVAHELGLVDKEED